MKTLILFLRQVQATILSMSVLYTATIATFSSVIMLDPDDVFAANNNPPDDPPPDEPGDSGSGSGSGTGTGRGTGPGTEDFCMLPENMQHESCQTTLEDDAADFDSMMTSIDHTNSWDAIMKIVIIICAVMFMMSCLNQPSGILFGVGAIIYIIWDMIGKSTLDANAEAMLRDLSFQTYQTEEMKSTGTEVAIQSAKDQLTTVKDAIDQRRYALITCITIWAFAVAFCIAEAFIEALTFGTKGSYCWGLVVNNNIPSFQDQMKYVDYAPTKSVSDGPLDFLFLKDILITDHADHSALLPNSHIEYPEKIKFSFVPTSNFPIQSNNSVMDFLLDLLIAKANAGTNVATDVLNGLGIAGAVAAIIFMFIISVNRVQGAGRGHAVARGIVIGVCIIKLSHNLTLLDDAKEKVEDREQKLQELLDRIQVVTIGSGGGTPSGDYTGPGGGGAFNPDSSDVDPLPPAIGAGVCTSTNLPAGSVTPAECSACAPNCANLGDQPDYQTVGFDAGLPAGAISDAQSGINNLRNLSNGGGTGPLLVTSGKLGNAKRVAKNAQKSFNDLLKKRNQPTTNFPSEMKKMNNAIMGAFNSTLNKLTPEEKALLQQYNDGNGTAGGDKAEPLKDDTYQKMLAAKNTTVPTTPGYAVPKMNVDYPEDTPVETATISSEAALSQYVIKQNDIHDATGPGLFDIIAVRYRKSAYPAFFRKKSDSELKAEGTPSAPTPPAANPAVK